jgi:hypothetical protein
MFPEAKQAETNTTVDVFALTSIIFFLHLPLQNTL